MIVAGLDPGPLETAYVLLAEDGRTILDHRDLENNAMLEHFAQTYPLYAEMGGMEIACEMVQHYGTGMAVGAEVFQTVLWIGRFQQKCIEIGAPFYLLYRPSIKQHLCHTVRATDSNVRQALIDLIGPGRFMETVEITTKKGLKRMSRHLSNGPTAGIAKHQWAALAVAVTRHAQAQQLNAINDLPQNSNGRVAG